MVLTAALLWAVNGAVSKVVLTGTDISASRYTELRTTGAFFVLGTALALVAPHHLRVRRHELGFLALYGVVGLALVQWLYFIAIERLPIGIALLIEFTGVVLVALWARSMRHEPVHARVWAAVAFALAGLALVAEVWVGWSLDAIGFAAAVASAFSLAVYLLLGEHGVRQRDPLHLVLYGMLFASVFWAIVQPWWSFPFGELTSETSLLGRLEDVTAPVWVLALWTIVLGTVVPFALSVGALRHLTATRVGITATFEPVAATVVAWAWLAESLSGAQVAGGAIVLTGILLALTSR